MVNSQYPADHADFFPQMTQILTLIAQKALSDICGKISEICGNLYNTFKFIKQNAIAIVYGQLSVVYICSMIPIAFPEPTFRFKKENEIEFIFDNIRKQWLVLNEEEWVRQNFVQYLIQTLNYPAAFIALEKEIMLGELKKRFDILIYDRNHKPWMIIECKAKTINLDDAVLQQALRYNISVPVPFLVITNGQYTYGWEKKGRDLKLMEALPLWK